MLLVNHWPNHSLWKDQGARLQKNFQAFQVQGRPEKQAAELSEKNRTWLIMSSYTEENSNSEQKKSNGSNMPWL